MSRFAVIGLIWFLVACFNSNNPCYIEKWNMYVKVENSFNDTTVFINNLRIRSTGEDYYKYHYNEYPREPVECTTVYLSDSKWRFGDNYIKYRPECAEMSNLEIYSYHDTLYAVANSLDILEIKSKDYIIKPVEFIRVDFRCTLRCRDSIDHWSDSTFIKNETKEWININHVHGIYTGWE